MGIKVLRESNNPRTLIYDAYKKIKKMIFDQELSPGQKLIYKDLGEMLGMSRTPIINALIRLEQEGFVASESFRGFYVRPIDLKEVWDAFGVREALEGAKEGFQIAIKIIPFLVAILVAIGAFRASGAMDMFIEGVRIGLTALGVNTDFVEALPTAMMKPLSGGAARGMMVDAMDTYGADSFVGRVASTVQGATDTTFYIIAVYFGSVGIKKTRYAVTCGLIADFVGIIAAISLAYLFFH